MCEISLARSSMLADAMLTTYRMRSGRCDSTCVVSFATTGSHMVVNFRAPAIRNNAPVIRLPLKENR